MTYFMGNGTHGVHNESGRMLGQLRVASSKKMYHLWRTSDREYKVTFSIDGVVFKGTTRGANEPITDVVYVGTEPTVHI
jgi:hypothetical protein